MEWLDVGHGRAVLFAAIDFDRASLAQLNSHDPRGGIGAKKERILLKFHPKATTRRIGSESRKESRYSAPSPLAVNSDINAG